MGEGVNSIQNADYNQLIHNRTHFCNSSSETMSMHVSSDCQRSAKSHYVQFMLYRGCFSASQLNHYSVVVKIYKGPSIFSDFNVGNTCHKS